MNQAPRDLKVPRCLFLCSFVPAIPRPSPLRADSPCQRDAAVLSSSKPPSDEGGCPASLGGVCRAHHLLSAAERSAVEGLFRCACHTFFRRKKYAKTPPTCIGSALAEPRARCLRRLFLRHNLVRCVPYRIDPASQSLPFFLYC